MGFFNKFVNAYAMTMENERIATAAKKQNRKHM